MWSDEDFDIDPIQLWASGYFTAISNWLNGTLLTCLFLFIRFSAASESDLYVCICVFMSTSFLHSQWMLMPSFLPVPFVRLTSEWDLANVHLDLIVIYLTEESVWIAFVRNRATVNWVRLTSVELYSLSDLLPFEKHFDSMLVACQSAEQTTRRTQSEEGNSFCYYDKKYHLWCTLPVIIRSNCEQSTWYWNVAHFHHRFISTKSTYWNKLDCIDDFKRTFSNNKLKHKTNVRPNHFFYMLFSFKFNFRVHINDVCLRLAKYLKENFDCKNRNGIRQK